MLIFLEFIVKRIRIGGCGIVAKERKEKVDLRNHYRDIGRFDLYKLRRNLLDVNHCHR